MKIWAMNLKDNRNNGENKSLEVKFLACKEHNLLAIGWADENINTSQNAAFVNAYNRLAEMKRNDLVWVKNAKTKEYYLCEVLNDRVLVVGEALQKNDIAFARICEFHPVESAVINTEFKKGSLTAISTIQGITDVETVEKTKALWQTKNI